MLTLQSAVHSTDTGTDNIDTGTDDTDTDTGTDDIGPGTDGTDTGTGTANIGTGTDGTDTDTDTDNIGTGTGDTFTGTNTEPDFLQCTVSTVLTLQSVHRAAAVKIIPVQPLLQICSSFHSTVITLPTIVYFVDRVFVI